LIKSFNGLITLLFQSTKDLKRSKGKSAARPRRRRQRRRGSGSGSDRDSSPEVGQRPREGATEGPENNGEFLSRSFVSSDDSSSDEEDTGVKKGAVSASQSILEEDQADQLRSQRVQTSRNLLEKARKALQNDDSSDDNDNDENDVEHVDKDDEDNRKTLNRKEEEREQPQKEVGGKERKKNKEVEKEDNESDDEDIMVVKRSRQKRAAFADSDSDQEESVDTSTLSAIKSANTVKHSPVKISHNSSLPRASSPELTSTSFMSTPARSKRDKSANSFYSSDDSCSSPIRYVTATPVGAAASTPRASATPGRSSSLGNTSKRSRLSLPSSPSSPAGKRSRLTSPVSTEGEQTLRPNDSDKEFNDSDKEAKTSDDEEEKNSSPLKTSFSKGHGRRRKRALIMSDDESD